MKLFPAIDLKGGQCVRLLRGDMDAATVYADDPGGQAGRFVAAGARYLHVVDLDGAVAGDSRNAAAVSEILAAAGEIPVQLGGGIRTRTALDGWLDAGVTRVILGSVALSDPDLVRGAAKDHPGGVVVGIDARDGMVAADGWTRTSTMSAVDLARAFEDAGVAALIHTDIDRDGTLDGPNIVATRELAAAVTIPVIASGGVGQLDDLIRIRAEAPMLEGVVVGRALYDGRIDLAEAIGILDGAEGVVSPC